MRRPREWCHHSRKKPSRSCGEEAAPHAGTHLLLSSGAAQRPIPLKPLFGRAAPSLECRCAPPPPKKASPPAREVPDSVSVAYGPTLPWEVDLKGYKEALLAVPAVDFFYFSALEVSLVLLLFCLILLISSDSEK